MIVTQIRTFPDGTLWLRWLEESEELREVADGVPASSAPNNCAACSPDEARWARAPESVVLPKVELIYECAACGRTTYQGRLDHER